MASYYELCIIARLSSLQLLLILDPGDIFGYLTLTNTFTHSIFNGSLKMHVFSYLLGTALSMLPAVSSTGIIIPLYVWPTDDSTWSPVYEAVSMHPNIWFQVIVNPDSGPGYTSKQNLI